jgi:hypothetical protein
VVHESASLKNLHGITKGEDLFASVCETVKELNLPWTKRLQKTGLQVLLETKQVRWVELGKKMGKQNPKFYMKLHYIVQKVTLW